MIEASHGSMTLQAIRDRSPCLSGWEKLLKGLGYKNGKYDPDRIISIGDVVITNDVVDAVWCVRALDWNDIAVRRSVISAIILPAVKRAAKHTTDQRVHDSITALQAWCDGDDIIDLEKIRQSVIAARRTAAAEAAEAAAAAAAAAAAEREQARQNECAAQRQDILTAFPPIALAHKMEDAK